MTFDLPVALWISGTIVAVPLTLAIAMQILLRSRPKATLKDAAEALATVIDAIRRRNPDDR